jgi:hypothetical protein
MPWGVAAAAVGGALVSGYASNQAANTQADAANNATDAQWRMYNQTVQNEQPFMDAGKNALNTLTGQLPTLNAPIDNTNWQRYMSPAYQFQLEQGRQALQNSQAASDGALSGAALKSLIRYNQDYANNGFQSAFNNYQTQNQNIYNRLAGLAQLGQNAASNTGMTGAGMASGIANTVTGAGNAAAAGTIGMGNAMSGGINNAMGYYMMNNLAGSNLFGGGPYGGTAQQQAIAEASAA